MLDTFIDTLSLLKSALTKKELDSDKLAALKLQECEQKYGTGLKALIELLPSVKTLERAKKAKFKLDKTEVHIPPIIEWQGPSKIYAEIKSNYALSVKMYELRKAGVFSQERGSQPVLPAVVVNEGPIENLFFQNNGKLCVGNETYGPVKEMGTLDEFLLQTNCPPFDSSVIDKFVTNAKSVL